MKKRLSPLLLGFVIASTLGAHGAFASTVSQQQNELALRLGAFFPTSSDAKDFGGSTQLNVGLDYTLSASRGVVGRAATGLYFDYLTGSNRSGYIHSGGLGLDFRTLGPAYAGLGLGVYNTSVRTPSGEMSASTTGGGGKVFVGFGLGSKASLQVDYHVLPTALGVNPNGVGLQLGYRL